MDKKAEVEPKIALNKYYLKLLFAIGIDKIRL